MQDLDGLGVPTAEAHFEYADSPAGLEMTPTALGTSVTVRLNGEPVTAFGPGDVGRTHLLPTSPGDRITAVSTDGDRSVLIERVVDDRDESGDLIASYDFSTGSGTTLVDRSGNENDGTLHGDPLWIETGERTGLAFDGTDDHVAIPDLTVGALDSVSAFTIAVSYRVTGTTGEETRQLVEPHSGMEWYLETEQHVSSPYVLEYAVDYSVRIGFRPAPWTTARRTSSSERTTAPRTACTATGAG